MGVVCAGAGVQWSGNEAWGQTLRDDVKRHVDSNLKTAPDGGVKATSEPTKKKPVPPPKAPTADGAVESPRGSSWSFSTDPQPNAAPVVTGPKLPKRTMGSLLALDCKVDGAYRGWLPQQYNSAEVKAGSYYTWSFELRGKLFKYVNLHRGYYESNALAGPRTKEASVAADVGKHFPKAAWLLAVVGVPISKAWEPTSRYESRAFNTTATPNVPLCIVDRDATDDLQNCPRTMNTLRIVSGIETLTLGVRYNHAKQGGPVISARAKVPPIFFGVGFMSYTKPYQVTIDGNTLSDYLFDGRFRGAGLALGTPDDWLIGYVQGTVTAGYRFLIVEGPPTIFVTPVASGGGASFHFLQTSQQDGEPKRTPNLNWDFLWSVRAAIEIAI